MALSTTLPVNLESRIMILSASRNFIFIHIPKTGGLSIEAMLQDYDEKAKRNVWNRVARQIHKPLPMKDALFGRHDSVRLVEKLSSDCKLTKLSSLAVVRNPYDHAVSHYNFLRTLPRHRYGERVRKLSFTQYLSLRQKPASMMTEVMRKDYWFLRLPDQTSFVSDDSGNIVTKQLLRLENLAEEWPEMRKKLGLPEAPLLHRNKGEKRDEKSYEEYYDDISKSLVDKIYKRDFLHFGYAQ